MNDVPLILPTSGRKPQVAVIGAGVAGMTAAHELAERGFVVYVYEEHVDPLRRASFLFAAEQSPDKRARTSLQLPPHVGGLAATQWCRIPDPRLTRTRWLNQETWQRADGAADWHLTRLDDWDDVGDLTEDERELRMWEARWPLLPFLQFDGSLGARWSARIQRIAGRLRKQMQQGSEHEEVVAIGGWASADECSPEDPGGESLAMRRARGVLHALLAALRGPYTKVEADPDYADSYKVLLPGTKSFRINAYGLGAELSDARGGRLHGAQRCVEIRIMDVLLPAEHGYRFFPSFYHHVFDTMRRIPLMERRTADTFKLGAGRDVHRRFSKDVGPALDPYRPSSRTVFDNLRSVDLHAFGGGGRFPLRALPRSNMLSVRSLLELLDTIQEQAGVSARDITRGQLRTLKFLTACAQRREQYEHVTWWDFVGADQGSREFQDLLVHWPQALVGLRAQDADARTFGTVLMQLLLDQIRPGGYRDGTLNGPTSEAWLEPWRDYLERELRVKFNTCRIRSISFRKDEAGRMWPQLRYNPGDDTLDDASLLVPDAPGFDYVVVATSVDAAARLGQEIDDELNRRRDVPGGESLREQFEASPLAAALACVRQAGDYQTDKRSGGPFRHFAGIQYFLDVDYTPLRGHVYYPQSAWRLSSVSQAQFRQDRPDVGDGYLGVVSVVIGAWDVVSPRLGRCAWECTEEEIAEEVWEQMMALTASTDVRPAQPRRFWIDENVLFAEKGTRTPERNTAPFLVNLAAQAGDWPERPGDYRVHFGSVVFAGTYLRTFTRLVTMEAANESARHAVNAILRHYRTKREPWAAGQDCSVFDPEARELEDLAMLKRLDEELVARGLPHMLDILGVEDFALDLAGPDADGPATILGALRRLADSSGGILREMIGFMRDLLSRR